MKKEDIKIIFMGCPDFAVESLKALYNCQYNIIGVVTNIDKPAGRGRKLSETPVKKIAIEYNLKIIQPDKLKAADFLNKLHQLKPDLFVIIAFRMLPKEVWNIPRLGAINLHASLLPNYRGAAPINWAIINGEKETGITTFFIQEKIDTGDIILQEKIEILENDNAGILYNKLMTKGADLILKTIHLITNNNYSKIQQASLVPKYSILKPAPKIFKPDCKINWENDRDKIHNFIRGLSPYPGAWMLWVNKKTDKKLSVKIFSSQKEITNHKLPYRTLVTDEKYHIKIAVKNGFIKIKELQLEGKKRMKTEDFLKGSNSLSDFYVI